jgi:hypothetical protein
MWSKIKEKFEWIIAGIVAIIVLAASKKRDSEKIVDKKDKELLEEEIYNVTEVNQQIMEDFSEANQVAQRKHKFKSKKAVQEKKDLKKELENNPEKLDNILKEKYNLKEG